MGTRKLFAIAIGMWVWPIAVYLRTGDFILAAAWMGIEILSSAVLLELGFIAHDVACSMLATTRKH